MKDRGRVWGCQPQPLGHLLVGTGLRSLPPLPFVPHIHSLHKHWQGQMVISFYDGVFTESLDWRQKFNLVL